MPETNTQLRCEGTQDELHNPGCDGPNVRLVAFKDAYDGKWNVAKWCDDCRAIARGNGIEMHTFTEHLGKCASCKLQFRGTLEAIEDYRQFSEPDATDADIVAGFEYCITCATGTLLPGERIAHTPDEQKEILRAITRYGEAQFACGDWRRDESDEEFDDVHQHAREAKSALLTLLGIPAEIEPRTSAESQAFIDGVHD